jgi:hypothetical protein
MKEIKFNINTGNGQVSFQTKKIEGFLNSLIVDSDNEIHLMIYSETGYTIYSREKVKGKLYISPRNWCDFPEHDQTDYFGFDKFLLNERLNIFIFGQNNQEIKLIIRFEELTK